MPTTTSLDGFSPTAQLIFNELKGHPEGLTRSELKMVLREEHQHLSSKEIDSALDELLGLRPKRTRQHIVCASGRYAINPKRFAAPGDAATAS